MFAIPARKLVDVQYGRLYLERPYGGLDERKEEQYKEGIGLEKRFGMGVATSGREDDDGEKMMMERR